MEITIFGTFSLFDYKKIDSDISVNLIRYQINMLFLLFTLFALSQGSLCDWKKDGDGICQCDCGTHDTDCTRNRTLPDCGAYMTCSEQYHYCITQKHGARPFDGFWYCAPERYGDGVCDCGCGQYDIDCQYNKTSPNCHTNETCVNGVCVPTPNGTAWTCRQELFNDYTVCHCNCGLHDPDCDQLGDTLTACAGDYLESDCALGSVCRNDKCAVVCPQYYKVETRYDAEMSAFCYSANICQPICGDGVNVGDEQCDHGVGCSGCKCSKGFYPYSPLTNDCQPKCGDDEKTYVEKCDGGKGCDNCSCQQGYYPIGQKYCGYCGDHVVNGPEYCDGGDGCNDNCSCLSGYESMGQRYCKYTKPDPNCTHGIINYYDSVCCSKWCGQCGGVGCGGSGGDNCCSNQIREHWLSCELHSPPCVMDKFCGNGRIDDEEKCDNGVGCYKCVCVSGYKPYTPVQNNCQPILDDNNTVYPEECDGGEGCDNGSCVTDYVPYIPPRPYCGKPDPLCQTGIPSILTSVCCDNTCGMCYDSHCSSRPGGRDLCCSQSVKRYNNSCRLHPPPCLIEADDLKKIDNPPDPSCARGVPSPRDTICCTKSCGKCGGNTCGTRPGGVHSCCEQSIRLSNRSCNLHTPPCIINDEVYASLGIPFIEDESDITSRSSTLLPYISCIILISFIVS